MRDKRTQGERKQAAKKGLRIAGLSLCCFAMLGAAILPGMGGVWAEESKILICTREEHTHSEACRTLTCENTDPAHVHDAGCYTLTCGKEEHTHSDACYEFVAPESASSAAESTSSSGNSSELSSVPEEPSSSETSVPDETSVPGETATDEKTPLPGETQISAFTLSEPVALEVERGTTTEDVCALLPKTLPAVDVSGAVIEVPVTWNGPGMGEYSELYNKDAYTFGSQYGYGPWTFTAAAGSAYQYGGEAITAAVTIPDCSEIANFCGISSDGLLMKFPVMVGDEADWSGITQTGAMMADGGYKNVPIAITGTYKTDIPGTYYLRIEVDGNYTGTTSAYAEVVVDDYQ